MWNFLGWLIALLILAGSAVVFFCSQQLIEPGPLTAEKVIEIPRGSGIVDNGTALKEQDVIQHDWAFILTAILTNQRATMKAGEYQFEAAVPMKQVLSKISKGQIFERKILVREGLTSYQVVQLLNAIDVLEGPLTVIPPEGSLMPDTYQYSRGEQRSVVLARMQDAMTKAVAELWPRRDQQLPLKNEKEAVVLASIVEKETGVPDERKMVAGVFINRLKIGMKLQTDPTVIYALTMGKHQDGGQGPLGRRLLRKDIEETNSPYNTYMYEGLPPGPIANAGRASLDAVLHPEMHDYLFFVADGKGGHIFAKTAAEHERNVVQWRKIRAASDKD